MLKSRRAFIDEAGMASFVPAHVAKQSFQIWVFNPLFNFRVQNATGKLSGDRGDEKIQQFAAKILRHAFKFSPKITVAHKVALVRIGA